MDFTVELLLAEHLTAEQRTDAERAFYEHIKGSFGSPSAAIAAWSNMIQEDEMGDKRVKQAYRKWFTAEHAARDAALLGQEQHAATFWCSFYEGVYSKPVVQAWPATSAPF